MDTTVGITGQRANVKLSFRTPTYKSKLDDTEFLYKQLKKSQKVLMDAALDLKKLIVKNWLRSRGADGKRFKNVTPQWAEIKGTNKRTLHWKGHMANSLQPVKKGKTGVLLTFKVPAEERKAKSNVRYAPGMMDASKKLRKMLTDIVLDELMK